MSDFIEYDGSMFDDGTIFIFTGDYTTTSKNGLFTLTADQVDKDGWYGGNRFNTLTISTNDDRLMITRIEIVLSYKAWNYGDAHLSSGTRKEGEVWADGKTVTVIDINAPSFSFDAGEKNSFTEYKDATIYYTCATHDYDENNICRICNQSKCDVEGHAYEKGVCTVCGDECKNEFHNGVYVCPDCLMEFDPTQGNPLVSGSTLSEGNMTIIFTIAALAIGLCGGFVIGRKKKPVLTDGTGAEDEE